MEEQKKEESWDQFSHHFSIERMGTPRVSRDTFGDLSFRTALQVNNGDYLFMSDLKSIEIKTSIWTLRYLLNTLLKQRQVLFACKSILHAFQDQKGLLAEAAGQRFLGLRQASIVLFFEQFKQTFDEATVQDELAQAEAEFLSMHITATEDVQSGRLRHGELVNRHNIKQVRVLL